jgi:four helix bundle protein
MLIVGYSNKKIEHSTINMNIQYSKRPPLALRKKHVLPVKTRCDILQLRTKFRKSMPHKFDLADRLIEFASNCLAVADALPKTFAGKHVAGQLTRSATSPAFHYGEAQAHESTADFIHKMSVCLKELRETYNCLKLIRRKAWYDTAKLDVLIKENDELIAIFVTSIRTVKRKNTAE